MDMILNLDGSILLWIQENLRGDFLNPLITLITTLGNGGLIWLVSSAVMLCFPKSRKTGVLVLMALLVPISNFADTSFFTDSIVNSTAGSFLYNSNPLLWFARGLV